MVRYSTYLITAAVVSRGTRDTSTLKEIILWSLRRKIKTKSKYCIHEMLSGLLRRKIKAKLNFGFRKWYHVWTESRGKVKILYWGNDIAYAKSSPSLIIVFKIWNHDYPDAKSSQIQTIVFKKTNNTNVIICVLSSSSHFATIGSLLVVRDRGHQLHSILTTNYARFCYPKYKLWRVPSVFSHHFAQ